MFSLKRTNSSSSKSTKKSDKSSKPTSLTESAIKAVTNEEGWEDFDTKSDVRSKVSSRSSKSDKKKSKGTRSRSTSRERKSKKDNDSSRRDSRRSKKDHEPVISPENRPRSERTKSNGDVVYNQFPGQFDPAIHSPSGAPHPMSSNVQSQFPGQFPTEFAPNAFGRAGKTVEEGGHGLAADYYGDQGQSVTSQPGVRPERVATNPPHLRPASSTPNPVADTGNGEAAEYYGSAATASQAHQEQPPRPSLVPHTSSTQVGASEVMSENTSFYTAPGSAKPASRPLTGGTAGVAGETYYAPPPQQTNGSFPAMAVGAAGLAAGAYAAHSHHQNSHSSIHINHSYEDQFTQGVPSSLGHGPFSASRHRHSGPIDKLLDIVQNKEDIRKMEEYTEYIGVCKYCFDPRSSARDAPRSHHYHRRRSSDSFKRRSTESLRQAARRKGKHSGVDKDSRYYSSSSSESESRRRNKNGWLGAGLAGYGLAKLGGALWNKKHDFNDTYSVKTGHSDRPPTYSSRESGRGSHRTERGAVRADGQHDYVRVRHADGSVSKEHASHRGHRPASPEASSRAHPPIHTSPRRSHAHSDPRANYRSRSQSPTLGQIFGFGGPNGKHNASSSSRRRNDRSPKRKGFFNFGNASSSSSSSEGAFGKPSNRRRPSPKGKRRNSGDHLQSTLLGIGATAAALAAAQAGRRPEVVAVREKKAKQGARERAATSRSHNVVEEDGWESASDSESAASVLAFGDSFPPAAAVRRRASYESLESQSSGTGKWSWRWGSSSKKKDKSVPSPQPTPSDTLMFTGIQPYSEPAQPTPIRPVEIASITSSRMEPMRFVDPLPVADSPAPSTVRPFSAKHESRPSAMPYQPESEASSRRFQDHTQASHVTTSPSHALRNTAIAGGFAAVAAGAIAADRARTSRQESIVRFDGAEQQRATAQTTDRKRSDRYDDRRSSHDTGRETRERYSQQESHQNFVGPTAAQVGTDVQYSMSGALPYSVQPVARTKSPPEDHQSQRTDRERELEALLLAKKMQLAEREVHQHSMHQTMPDTIEESGRVAPVVDAIQDPSVGYYTQTFVPSRRYTDDEDSSSDSSPVGNSHDEHDLSRQAEIARNAAARIVADMAERYNSPQVSQAEFFSPKELDKKAILEDEEEARKAAIKAWVPNADVQIQYTMHANDFRISNRKAIMAPRKDGVPHLGLIVPTPPISTAGSVLGQKSPVSSHLGEEEAGVEAEAEVNAEVADKPRSDKSANRVSWGPDDTRVYEIQSPHQSPKLEKDTKFPNGIEASKSNDKDSERFTFHDLPSASIPFEHTVYTAEPEVIEQNVLRDANVGDRAEPFYRSPFFETVSDLGFALDSPGTEGAPPVQGFVEGEVDEPTPATEKDHFMPGSFDQDESLTQSPKVPHSTKPDFDQSPRIHESSSDTGVLDRSLQKDDNAEVDSKSDLWDVGLSKKDRKKREKAARREAEEFVDALSNPSAEKPFESPLNEAIEDAWEPPLSKKEKKKREKLARQFTDEIASETTSPAPMPSTNPTEIEEVWERPLSKKEQKKRDKLAKQSKDFDIDAQEFDSKSQDQAPEQEPTWEPPLTKKEQKRRDKLAKLAGEEPNQSTSASVEADPEPEDWEPALSKKELKKREKRDSTQAASPALTESPTKIEEPEEFWSKPLSKKDKKKLEKERRRSAGDSILKRTDSDVSNGQNGYKQSDTINAHSDEDEDYHEGNKEKQKSFGDIAATLIAGGAAGTVTEKVINSKRHSKAEDRSDEDIPNAPRDLETEYDVPGSFQEKDRFETDEERRLRKKKSRQSVDFDDAMSSISGMSGKSSKLKGERDDSSAKKDKKGILGLFRRKSSDTNGQEESPDRHHHDSRTERHHRRKDTGDLDDSRSTTSSTRRSHADYGDPPDDSKRNRRRDSTPSERRDNQDQSFLARRIENEELQSLSANPLSSPTLAPESVTETISPKSASRLLHEEEHNLLEPTDASPIGSSSARTQPFPIETPRRPSILPVRPSSTTAIPIRFRKPPQTPSAGNSPVITHQRSESFGASVPLSPDSPAIHPPRSHKSSRPRSTEIRREFQPLYLVEHNRKPSDVGLEEEKLPPLPPSEEASRASSLRGSDGYESAVEEQTLSEAAALSLPLSDLGYDPRTEDVLSSSQTTPRATHFPPDVLTHRQRAEPEFYSWEDILREEKLRDELARTDNAATSTNPDLVDAAENNFSDHDKAATTDIMSEPSSAFVTPFEEPESMVPRSYMPDVNIDPEPASTLTKNLEEPEREFTLKPSKKDKKKKAKALKLGTAIVSADDGQQRLSAEEATKRQEQDTQDAIDGLFSDAPAFSYTPKSKKKGKSRASSLWDQTLELSTATGEEGGAGHETGKRLERDTGDDLQISHDALKRAETAIAAYEIADMEPPRQSSATEDRDTTEFEAQRSKATDERPLPPDEEIAVPKVETMAEDEWAMAPAKSKKKQNGKKAKNVRLDFWTDAPEPGNDHDSLTVTPSSDPRPKTESPATTTNDCQDEPSHSLELEADPFPQAANPEREVKSLSESEKRKAKKKGKTLDFWSELPVEQGNPSLNDKETKQEVIHSSADSESFLDRKPSDSSESHQDKPSKEKDYWAVLTGAVAGASVASSVDNLGTSKADQTDPAPSNVKQNPSHPGRAALSEASVTDNGPAAKPEDEATTVDTTARSRVPLWTAEDVVFDESSRLAGPQLADEHNPGPQRVSDESRPASFNENMASDESQQILSPELEPGQEQQYTEQHITQSGPLSQGDVSSWSENHESRSLEASAESITRRDYSEPLWGAEDMALDESSRLLGEGEFSTRHTEQAPVPADSDDWGFPVTKKSKKDKKKKGNKGVVMDPAVEIKGSSAEVPLVESASASDEPRTLVYPVHQTENDPVVDDKSLGTQPRELAPEMDPADEWAFPVSKKTKKDKKKGKSMANEFVSEPKLPSMSASTSLPHPKDAETDEVPREPVQSVERESCLDRQAEPDTELLQKLEPSQDLTDPTEDAQIPDQPTEEFAWTTTKKSKKDKKKAKKAMAIASNPEVSFVSEPTLGQEATPGRTNDLELGSERSSRFEQDSMIAPRAATLFDDNVEPRNNIKPENELEADPEVDLGSEDKTRLVLDIESHSRGEQKSELLHEPEMTPADEGSRQLDDSAERKVAQEDADFPVVAALDESADAFSWTSTKKSKKDKKKAKKAAALAWEPEDAPRPEAHSKPSSVVAPAIPESAAKNEVEDYSEAKDEKESIMVNDPEYDVPTVKDYTEDTAIPEEPIEDFSWTSTKKSKKDKKKAKNAEAQTPEPEVDATSSAFVQTENKQEREASESLVASKPLELVKSDHGQQDTLPADSMPIEEPSEEFSWTTTKKSKKDKKKAKNVAESTPEAQNEPVTSTVFDTPSYLEHNRGDPKHEHPKPLTQDDLTADTDSSGQIQGANNEPFASTADDIWAFSTSKKSKKGKRGKKDVVSSFEDDAATNEVPVNIEDHQNDTGSLPADTTGQDVVNSQQEAGDGIWEDTSSKKKGKKAKKAAKGAAALAIGVPAAVALWREGHGESESDPLLAEQVNASNDSETSVAMIDNHGPKFQAPSNQEADSLLEHELRDETPLSKTVSQAPHGNLASTSDEHGFVPSSSSGEVSVKQNITFTEEPEILDTEQTDHPLERMIMPTDLRDLAPIQTSPLLQAQEQVKPAQELAPFGDWSIDPLLDTSVETPDEYWARMTKKKKSKKSKKGSLLNTPISAEPASTSEPINIVDEAFEPSKISDRSTGDLTTRDTVTAVDAGALEEAMSSICDQSQAADNGQFSNQSPVEEPGISRIKESPRRDNDSDIQRQQSSHVSSEMEQTAVMGVDHAPVVLPSSELMEDEREPLLSRRQSVEWGQERRDYGTSSRDASRPSSSLQSSLHVQREVEGIDDENATTQPEAPVREHDEDDNEPPKEDEPDLFTFKLSKKDKKKDKKKKQRSAFFEGDTGNGSHTEAGISVVPDASIEGTNSLESLEDSIKHRGKGTTSVPDQFRLSRPLSTFDWADDVEAANVGDSKSNAEHTEHAARVSDSEGVGSAGPISETRDVNYETRFVRKPSKKEKRKAKKNTLFTMDDGDDEHLAGTPDDLPQPPPTELESSLGLTEAHMETRSRERSPPQMAMSRSPSQDIDFAATLAAGLNQSGFDSNVVIEDPAFHRRSTPPGTMAEADPEEAFPLVGKKSKKGRKASKTDFGVLSETSQPSDTIHTREEPLESRPRSPVELSGNRKLSSNDNDDFNAVLAASLGAAGFAASKMLQRSNEALDKTAESDVSPFTMPRKKRKGKKSNLSTDDYFGEEATRASIAATEAKPLESQEAERKDIAIETRPQDQRDLGRDLTASPAPIEAAEDEWALPSKKKGKKGKGKNTKSAPLAEPTRVESEKPSESLPLSMGKKGKKKNKKGMSFDWSTEEPAVEQPTTPLEPKDDPSIDPEKPKRMIHTSEISQSLPTQLRDRSPSPVLSRGHENLHRETKSPDASSIKIAQTSGWSFEGLDSNRDSGLPGEEATHSESREMVRDSGYDTIGAGSNRDSGDKYDVPETIPENERTGHESDERSEASWENWEFPVNKSRSADVKVKNADTEHSRHPSPVESATKDRTSYLFQTPPTGEREGMRPANLAHTLKEVRTELPKDSDIIPVDHVPMESPIRKRSKANSDVGAPEHGVKSTRRSETPQQSFRNRPAPLDLHEEQLRQRPNGQSRLQSLRSPTAMSSASAAGSLQRLRSPDAGGTPSITASIISNESPTPSLRRTDRSISGDLRHRAQTTPRGDATTTNNPPFRPPPTPPLNDDERAHPASADMAGSVFEGFGGGEPLAMSPTRAQSMRRKQSSHIMDLEARVDALIAENERLHELKGGQISGQGAAAQRALDESRVQLQEKDAQINQIRAMLDPLQQELERLTEVNSTLGEANRNLIADTNDRYATLQDEHKYAHEQWQQSARELDKLRLEHSQLSNGMESIVRQHIDAALEDKDTEIVRLRAELDLATSQIRELQAKIQASTSDDFLVVRDEDYFDAACQKLCQHVQTWVLRFSKASDNRACRLTSDIKDDKLEARLDNCMLDGSDVDNLLVDRIRRRDIFMALFMMLIWEYVFTRYLFGMDREQRQKLKSLEKLLMEVGPPRAVAQWRATTLTLLSQRPAFDTQRNLDHEAVTFEIYNTLAALLPPPRTEEAKLQTSLKRVTRLAIDLSIEMRTQRADYFMLPPPMPEYNANGDLVGKTRFEANTMSERSGDYASNEELQAQNAMVKVVLFPLVMKKGDDAGEGGDEAVICPAQVLVAASKHSRRVVRQKSGVMSVDDDKAMSLGTADRSRVSLMSGIEGGSHYQA